MILLKDAGVGGAEVSVNKLQKGHGETVLHILAQLCKLVLSKLNFRFEAPIYPDEALADEAEVDADAIADDVDMDDAMLGGRMDDEDPTFNAMATDEKITLDESELHDGVLESQIDPQEWLLELERVAPKLKTTASMNNASDAKEWRTHLLQTKSYQEVIEDTFPDAKAGLEALYKELNTVNDKIKQKETFINSQFDSRTMDYRNRQEEFNTVNGTYTQLNESVLNFQNDLKNVTEELDEVKEKMEKLSNTVTDTAPIVKIKDAFQKLRNETRQIEVKIGVVGHTLMQAKLRQKKTDPSGLLLAGGDHEDEGN